MRCSELYAQEVLEYAPEYAGFAPPTWEPYTDPEEALGAPDFTQGPNESGAVALGVFGRLSLGVGDCLAKTSGDSEPDLHVYEIGGNVEYYSVYLRPTARGWSTLGQDAGSEEWVLGGVADGDGFVDLDGPGGRPAVEFDAVQLRDENTVYEYESPTPGADIDSVEFLLPIDPFVE